jgi:hypothetical protein
VLSIPHRTQSQKPLAGIVSDMRNNILTIILFLSTINCVGQKNNISVDSLKKTLNCSWTAIATKCGQLPSDTLVRKMVFSKDTFKYTQLKNGSEISQIKGTYKIDSLNNTGYVMTVTLDKESIRPRYNSLLLNIDIYEADKIYVTLFEVFYYKGEQKAIHYPGDYQLYRD